jgi:hypothetical protein
MSETTFVRISAVKDFNKEAGYRSDGELIEALNTRVSEILTAAQERARTNGRSTIRPGDL